MATRTMQSNEAKVSDVSAVNKVLAGYTFLFDVRIEPKDGAKPGVIAIGKRGDSPWAVSKNDLRNADSDGARRWQDLVFSLFPRHDLEVFADLMRNLAPHLLTPLTVVWSAIESSSRKLVGAVQWTVWPGSPYVQVQRVEPPAVPGLPDDE